MQKLSEKLIGKEGELGDAQTELRQKVKEGKCKERVIEHAEAKATASAEKQARDRAHLEKEVKHLKQQRNEAREEKREWKKQAAAYQKAARVADERAAKVDKMVKAAEADTTAMVVELEEVEHDLDEMSTELLRARALLSAPAKRELGILVEGSHEVGLETVSLIGVLGKKTIAGRKM